MKRFLYSTAIAALLVVIGYKWLDLRIAGFVLTVVGSNFLHSGTVSNMPDILLTLVCFVTVASWSVYLYLARNPSKAVCSYFFKVIGLTAPLAYLLKTATKYLVGRTNTRLWLEDPGLYGVHWFHGGGDFSGFPSGHMAVFTALMLGISRYFPRLRRPCIWFLALLGLALIVTEYHYFSDVIAGAYLGLAVDTLVCRELPHDEPCPRPGKELDLR